MNGQSKILIVGFGSFGKLLAEILQHDHEVLVWNRSNKKTEIEAIGCTPVNISTGISECSTIFYAVPISKFEETLQQHVPLLEKSGQKLVIDVLSVKVHAKKVFEELLPKNCRALLTHPVFGPQSVRAKGLEGHTMMMDRFTANEEEFILWKHFWRYIGLDVIEISADEHDRLAANSQGVAFFLSRVLEEFDFKQTSVDTHWAKQLYEITENLNKDNWELFVDMQNFNPYTKDMRKKLDQSLHKIDSKLEKK